MSKGFMQWKHTDVSPTSQGFGYYRINSTSNPTKVDPYFKDAWNKAGGTERGIYQFPVVNATYSIAQNVDFMGEMLGNYAGGLNSAKDMPIMFCALYLGLTDINLYLDYLDIHIRKPDWPLPLIYTTADHWGAIQVGDNAETVAKKIMDRADVCLSDWKCTLPGKLDRWPVIRGWEYANGYLQIDPSGTFIKNDNPIPITDPIPPGTDPVVTGGFIHLQCPKCKYVIF